MASGHGVIAVAGGLFIAGWSAYGSELALSYGTEYRRGTKDAVKTLITMAAVSVVVYSMVPLLPSACSGCAGSSESRCRTAAVAEQVAGGLANLVVGVLILAPAARREHGDDRVVAHPLPARPQRQRLAVPRDDKPARARRAMLFDSTS